MEKYIYIGGFILVCLVFLGIGIKVMLSHEEQKVTSEGHRVKIINESLSFGQTVLAVIFGIFFAWLAKWIAIIVFGVSALSMIS